MYAWIKLCIGRSVLLQVRKFVAGYSAHRHVVTILQYFRAVCREFGIQIGRLWLIFQLFSPGMFVASTAFLPSSFAMLFCSAALAAWWHQRYNLAVYFVAIAALLGKFYSNAIYSLVENKVEREKYKDVRPNEILNLCTSRLAICCSYRSTLVLRYDNSSEKSAKIGHLDGHISSNYPHSNDVDWFVIFWSDRRSSN